MPKKAEKKFKNCNLAREGGTGIELDKHYQDQSIQSGTQKYSTVETQSVRPTLNHYATLRSCNTGYRDRGKREREFKEER